MPFSPIWFFFRLLLKQMHSKKSGQVSANVKMNFVLDNKGDYDSNEYAYTTSPLSRIDAWKLPLTSNGSREEKITNRT